MQENDTSGAIQGNVISIPFTADEAAGKRVDRFQVTTLKSTFASENSNVV